MSKGHGTVQRYLLAFLDESHVLEGPGIHYSLLAIAHLFAAGISPEEGARLVAQGDLETVHQLQPPSRAQYESMRRAAHLLRDEKVLNIVLTRKAHLWGSLFVEFPY